MSRSTAAKRVRYIYFAILRWLEKSSRDPTDAHIQAAMVVSLLAFFPILLLATVLKVLIFPAAFRSEYDGISIIVGVIILVVLGAAAYMRLVRRDRWRDIRREFSNLDELEISPLQFAFRVFVWVSIAALFLSVFIAAISGASTR